MTTTRIIVIVLVLLLVLAACFGSDADVLRNVQGTLPQPMPIKPLPTVALIASSTNPDLTLPRIIASVPMLGADAALVLRKK